MVGTEAEGRASRTRMERYEVRGDCMSSIYTKLGLSELRLVERRPDVEREIVWIVTGRTGGERDRVRPDVEGPEVIHIV